LALLLLLLALTFEQWMYQMLSRLKMIEEVIAFRVFRKILRIIF
jgi:hypothetical protein